MALTAFMNETPNNQTGTRSQAKAPPDKPTDINSRRSSGGGFGCWWILGVLVALIIIPTLLTNLITDWMWFGSQGLADVYTTRLWLGVGVFFGAGIIATIFCWVNWFVASR